MGLGGVLAVFSVVYLIVAASGIAFYVFTALPMYKFAKRVGYENAWLAWIPFTYDFVLVKISEYNGSGKLVIRGIEYNRNTVAWFTVWGVLLNLVPAIGSIAFVILRVLITGACCRDLYSKTENKNLQDVVVLGYASGFFHVILTAKLWQYIYSISRYNVRNNINKDRL